MICHEKLSAGLWLVLHYSHIHGMPEYLLNEVCCFVDAESWLAVLLFSIVVACHWMLSDKGASMNHISHRSQYWDMR